MTTGPLWKCPRPGCEYVAQLLPSSNLEMVIRYHEATNHAARGEPEFSEDPSFEDERLEPGVIIWDDPPPRPGDNQAIIDWYRDQRSLTDIADIADSEWVNETDEVHCATWLGAAAFALAAAGVVYLSYRWSGR